MDDERFKHIATDPKYRRIPKREKKVKIDKRFQSMFKDKKFNIKYTTDKRGRPVNHTSTEDLKRYYELSSTDEESSESDNENEAGKYVKLPKGDNEETVVNELEIKDKSDKILSEKVTKKLNNLNVDYARGESRLNSESSSDDEPSESEEGDISESETIDHKWGELDADAEQTDEITHRLAACNMDWDRIRAVDLMVLFNSFLQAGGAIKSVVIYPSEFGKERLKEEEVKGPIELVESKTSKKENTKNEDENNEEGSSYHMEKLRQYQLNRLKYYYAVITFDSANSANKVYTECDGMEYESSAIKLDLRFIPNDMTFDDEPKDFCDKLPEVNKYQPRFFTTTALQQAKVNLTWDETNPDRIEFTQKLTNSKSDDITEADLRNYLASSSGESNSEEENDDGDEEIDTVDKYRALLQGIEEKERSKKENDVEMEISWGIDLKETTEKKLKQKESNADEKTPFQKYLEKRKQKKKEKQKKKQGNLNKNESGIEDDSDVPSDIDLNDTYFAEEFNKPEFKRKSQKKDSESNEETNQNEAELELLLMNEDDNKNHFNLKKIQELESDSKKKKKKQEEKVQDDFEINVKDDRFSALFTSHHYNIDPTDPHYKKTKGMEVLINEKLKRRVEGDDDDGTAVKKSKMSKEKGELSMLVKSVKRKTEEFKKTFK